MFPGIGKARRINIFSLIFLMLSSKEQGERRRSGEPRRIMCPLSSQSHCPGPGLNVPKVYSGEKIEALTREAVYTDLCICRDV